MRACAAGSAATARFFFFFLGRQLSGGAPSNAAVAWNSVLRRAVAAGEFAAAMEIFENMRNAHHPPDGYTYPLLLKACSDAAALDRGREIYRSAAAPNVFTQCAAVDMFAKCGSLHEARQVFDEMPHRDLVSWTTMICGAMHNGSWSEALILFKNMRFEGMGFDSVAMATVAPASGRLGSPNLATSLHSAAISGGVAGDVCVLNSFIDTYCKCGLTTMAESLFSSMAELRDSITWTTLVSGYSQNRQYSKVFSLLSAMVAAGELPTAVTLAGALPAFSELRLLKPGRQIHAYAIKNFSVVDSFLSSAIIDLYSRCRLTSTAELVFQVSPERDLSVWNSLISGYSMAGEARSGFEALKALIAAGLRPDSVTVAAALPLCSRSAILGRGRELHCYAIKNLFFATTVSNALIDMYCKCGILERGEKLFHRAEERDAATFNTMIAAMGMHGRAREAISFFSAMADAEIEPNGATFTAVLSACSHGGLVEEGLSVFSSIKKLEMEHYACAVDLHGRAGRIEEAWDLLKRMPEEPGVEVLGSLLEACRFQKREKLAEEIGERMMEKKKKVEDLSYYLLLANSYAWFGKWEAAARVRRVARERGLRKKAAGRSWVETGGAAAGVGCFVAGDGLHRSAEEMDGALRSLLGQMKDHGHSCCGDLGDDYETLFLE